MMTLDYGLIDDEILYFVLQKKLLTWPPLLGDNHDRSENKQKSCTLNRIQMAYD